MDEKLNLAENKKPDYDYSQGLSSEVRDFATDGNVATEKERLSPERLHILDVQQSVRKKVAETVGGAATIVGASSVEENVKRELLDFKTVLTKTGGKIEYALVNNGTPKKTVTIMNTGFGDSWKKRRGGAREVAAAVANNPDSAYLVIHSPGVEGSTPLPKDISKRLAATGEFDECGNYVADALTGLLGSFDRIDLTGNSQGGRHAIALAYGIHNTMGRDVQEVRVSDPVGSRRRSFRDLMGAFTAKEGAHAGAYEKASKDSAVIEFYEKNPASAGIRNMMDFMKFIGHYVNHFGFSDALRQAKALCSDSLMKDLRKALPYIKGRLLINSPELSELSNPEDVKKILQILATEEVRPTVIQQRVMTSRTHSFQSGNPGVSAAVLSEPEVARGEVA